MTARAAALPRAPTRSAWTPALTALGLVAILLLSIYRVDLIDIGRIWWNSATFQHLMLVPWVIAWLVWQRRGELARVVPAGWAPGLILAGLGAAAWLVGAASSVAFARHLGLVMMAQGAVVALLGRQASLLLAFPIGYALLLAPFGDFLVQPLQMLTADICITLLRLFGVPTVTDGVLIRIPNGYYEVAEACAGTNFVLAMAAFAIFASWQGFVSWPRRIAFLLFALAMPVLANGIRAFATIYVGWIFDVDAAAGFDHVVYGWIFFSFTLAATLVIAWRFFDRDPHAPVPVPHTQRRVLALPTTAALLIGITAAPAAWNVLSRGAEAPIDQGMELPDIPGWTRAEQEPGPPWAPHYAGADLRLFGSYRDAAGATVDLGIAAFARQEEGRELVGFGQGAIAPGSPWIWTARTRTLDGAQVDRITAPGGVVREVATFYRLGGTMTGSERRVKLETLRIRLTGAPPGAAAVTIASTDRNALERFAAALGSVAPIADAAFR